MLDINKNGAVNSFVEKPKGDGSRINGGFFVLSPKVLDLIDSHKCMGKRATESLASENELIAYRHNGFWQPMDTLRDKIYLEELYESKNAPWVKW